MLSLVTKGRLYRLDMFNLTYRLIGQPELQSCVMNCAFITFSEEEISDFFLPVVFGDMISLCIPGYFRTCSIDQAGLELSLCLLSKEEITQCLNGCMVILSHL